MHLCRNTPDASGHDEPHGKPSQSDYALRAVPGPYAAALLALVPPYDIVATVLDAPVTAVDIERTPRIGVLGGPACDTWAKSCNVILLLFSYHRKYAIILLCIVS